MNCVKVINKEARHNRALIVWKDILEGQIDKTHSEDSSAEIQEVTVFVRTQNTSKEG